MVAPDVAKPSRIFHTCWIENLRPEVIELCQALSSHASLSSSGLRAFIKAAFKQRPRKVPQATVTSEAHDGLEHSIAHPPRHQEGGNSEHTCAKHVAPQRRAVHLHVTLRLPLLILLCQLGVVQVASEPRVQGSAPSICRTFANSSALTRSGSRAVTVDMRATCAQTSSGQEAR